MNDHDPMQETARQYEEPDSKLYVSAQNIRNILDGAPIAIVIAKLSNNRIVYVNQKFCEVFRTMREDTIGDISANYWAIQADREKYMRLFEAQGFVKDFETIMKRHNGEEFQALGSSSIIEYDGEKARLSGVLDIQERKDLETKISESEERFRTIVEKLPFPVVITRANDHVVVYLNPIAEAVGLVSKEEAVGQQAKSFVVVPADRRRLAEDVRLYGCVNNFETMLTNNHGRMLHVLISAVQTVYDGEKVLLSGVQDITSLKLMEQKLRKLATTDYLTNIANRRAWFDRAEQELLRFQRYGHPCSILCLDLDHFKQVNDRYGHQVGDEILIDFTHRSQQCIRDLDYMGRIGGEEFAVLLPETDVRQAEKVAAKIQDTIRKSYVTKQGAEILYTVSIGITQFCQEDATFDQALSRADKALYAAKKAGRNRFITA